MRCITSRIVLTAAHRFPRGLWLSQDLGASLWRSACGACPRATQPSFPDQVRVSRHVCMITQAHGSLTEPPSPSAGWIRGPTSQHHAIESVNLRAGLRHGDPQGGSTPHQLFPWRRRVNHGVRPCWAAPAGGEGGAIVWRGVYQGPPDMPLPQALHECFPEEYP
jgi:hypothetical protein